MEDPNLISPVWLELEEEYGDRLLGQCRNRRWKELYNRYGTDFGLSYEELRAWGKWLVKRNAVPEEPVESAEPAKSIYEQYVSKKKIWYDSDSDIYTTYLPGVPHAIEIPGDMHRDIIKAYSNFDGDPASVNEIARTFELPRQWVVKYLRAHEVTHDREPFTPEEIMSRSEDDLAEEALQSRRASLYRRMENDRWKAIRKEANNWREFEDVLFKPLLSALANKRTEPVKKLNIKPAQSPYAVVLGLSDYHWGKYSDPGENWERFDRKMARERLFSCTENIVERLSKFGAPEKIYVPVGSDFFQIDNDLGGTTRGTSQDMDGTPAEILVSGCFLMEEWIETLRQFAPVELVLMSGNHDRMLGVSVLMYLDALYRDATDVTVNRDRTPRVYKSYGSNLIGFVHGDGVNKTNDLCGHMARESGEAWAKCKHKTIYTGHFHNEKTETDTLFGVTRRQLPSLSGPDRWHARNGYTGAPKSLPAYCHDKEKGLLFVIYSPVD